MSAGSSEGEDKAKDHDGAKDSHNDIKHGQPVRREDLGQPGGSLATNIDCFRLTPGIGCMYREDVGVVRCEPNHPDSWLPTPVG